MSERERTAEQRLRDTVLPDALKVLSVEQLEFRRHALEERLPAITSEEGVELANLYAYFRKRK